jgi:hypothetical protein
MGKTFVEKITVIYNNYIYISVCENQNASQLFVEVEIE